MGVRHQDMTGRGAIHPFAFVGATDPALDADNAVGPYKGWLDTTNPSVPVLRVRNAANDAWLTVTGGGGGGGFGSVQFIPLDHVINAAPALDFIADFGYPSITEKVIIP